VRFRALCGLGAIGADFEFSERSMKSFPIRTHVRPRSPNALSRCIRVSLVVGIWTALGFVGATRADAGVNVQDRGSDREGPIGGAPSAIVTTCEDDLSAGSLRAMLQNAHAGDTIDLTQLTCSKVTLQNGALVAPVSVTLQGLGAAKLAIDGNNMSRIITSTGDLTLIGLTLENGATTDYGGCIFSQGKLTVRQSTMTNCHLTGGGVARGGAIRAVGDLTLVQSVVSESSAVSSTHDARGGAIYAYATTKVYDSTISNNLCQSGNGISSGGGIFAHGSVGIFGSKIDANIAKSGSAPTYGGAIHQAISAPIVIDNSILTNNLAHSESNWSYGGGISSGRYGGTLPGKVTISYSTISHNIAESNCFSACIVSGGGVHAEDSITTTYSTVDNNEARCLSAGSACVAGGGGLAIFGNRPDSSLWLMNSTVSSNQSSGGTGSAASGFGGGIAIVSSSDRTMTALHATIAFNHANKSGGGIAWQSTQAPSNFVNTIAAQNRTDSGEDDVSRGPFGSVAFDVAGSNNIVVSSGGIGVSLPTDTVHVDPALLPLANNGGPTQTHALGVGSVAIDHGASGFAIGCDQRGWPFTRPSGAMPDIGAFEAQDTLMIDGFDPKASCVPAP
jgi:hypothetical protein